MDCPSRGRGLRALRAALLALSAGLPQCSAASSNVAAPPSGAPDAGFPTGEAGPSEAGGVCADAGPDAAFLDVCYPDGDGINGGSYTFDLTVDDTGFSKMILSTQNDAQVTITLRNTGAKPHGFTVGCTNVTSVYPNLPSGCSPDACFPCNATIPPLAPGASATITFDTPTPDGLIYPFKSTAPADATVPGLNEGQWSLM